MVKPPGTPVKQGFRRLKAVEPAEPVDTSLEEAEEEAAEQALLLQEQEAWTGKRKKTTRRVQLSEPIEWGIVESTLGLGLHTFKTDQLSATEENRREIAEVSASWDYRMSTPMLCTAFLDYGGDCDLIKRERFDYLKVMAGEVRHEAIHTVEKRLIMHMADGSARDEMFELVSLCVRLRLRGVPVLMRLDIVIMDSLVEDMIIGKPTMDRFGLVEYIANPERWRLERDQLAPEELEIEIVEIMPLTVDDYSVRDVKVGEDFPKKKDLLKRIQSHHRIFNPLNRFEIIDCVPFSVKLKPNAELKQNYARRCAPAIQEQVDLRMEQLVTLGMMEKNDNCSYASPIVASRRPGTIDVRVCGDYSLLNDQTEPLVCPMANIDEMLQASGGHLYYAKLDAPRGYHQCALDSVTRQLLSVVTVRGVYTPLRLPFGPKNGPAYFVSVMKNILAGLLLVICALIVDDILIWGDTVDEFIENCCTVLTRLEARNVHLRPNKSQFGVSRIFFCGHWLCKQGIELGDDRKLIIQSCLVPKNVKALRSFLGMSIYFKKFVENYSILAKPLHAATELKHKKGWIFTEEMKRHFDVLKAAIMGSKFLFHPDYNYPIVVRSDASDLGIGCVVLNLLPDGERPLIFLSHAFSGPAVRWHTFEKEAYAPVYAVLKLDYMLLGHHFFLETDHRNLIWLSESTIPKCQRWSLRLQEFDFTIIHSPGVTMGGPDFISRLKSQRVCVSATPTGEDEIDTDVVIEIYHNGIVGHMGINATHRRLLAAGFRWVKMIEDIEAFVRRCPTCQKMRHGRENFSAQLKTVERFQPFQCVAADFFGPFPKDEDGNQFIHLMMDVFGRFAVATAEPTNTAYRAFRSFLTAVVAYTGPPDEILSDRGPHYTAEIFDHFRQYFSIEKKFTYPHRHQSNPAERDGQEITRHLRAIVYDKRLKDRWSVLLPLVLYIHNCMWCFAIGTSPMRLRFGESVTPFRGLLVQWEDAPTPAEETYEAHIQQLSADLTMIVQVCQEHQSRELAKRLRASPEESDFYFHEGDFVTARYPNRPPHKLSPRYRGPLVVLNRRGDVYDCQDLLTQQVCHFHLDDLKMYIHDERESREWVTAPDRDQYFVDAIVDHRGDPRRKSTLEFRIRWRGFGEEEDTWLLHRYVKDLEALTPYLLDHPELRMK